MPRGKRERREKGSGSFFTLPDGRYAWEISESVGGKPKTTRITRRDPDELRREVAAFLKEREAGGTGQGGQEWLQDFLARAHTILEPGWAPRTRTFYRLQFGTISQHLGGLRLRELRPTHVDQMTAALLDGGLSKTSVNHVRRALAFALKLAQREGAVAQNAANLSLPRGKNEVEIVAWTRAEVQDFLSAIENHPHELVYHVAFFWGLRRGENLGMLKQHVDLEAGVYRVRGQLQKTKHEFVLRKILKTSTSRREGSIQPRMEDKIRQHLARQAEMRLAAGGAWEERGLLFTNELGGPLLPDTISHEFLRLQRQHGVQNIIPLKNARHTCATLLLESGVNPEVVQKLMGHSQLTTTLKYYSLVRSERKEEAQATLDRYVFG